MPNVRSDASLGDRERLTGLILGTAVGDALGLPAEGMRPDRIERCWRGKWKMRLLFGHGMVSDDTEHTLMVAEALALSPPDVRAFQRKLAWKFRWWFAAAPAGVGLATARACTKLWWGFPPSKSGVHSAGNGPAMRAAIIGAFFASDPVKLADFVSAATRITHTDPRAEVGARAVAEAAACAMKAEPKTLLLKLETFSNNDEWLSICAKINDALNQSRSVREFASCLGLSRGVSGYIFHTVPVALYAWLRHSTDFRQALTAALDCGGDTDTVGAIVGGLVGANVGIAGIPVEWTDSIIEWPRSTRYMKSLAHRLASTDQQPVSLERPRYFWPGVIPRNLLFLAIVLLHGFRRLFPKPLLLR